MATEIVPGIYQLQVPFPFNPLEKTNAYLLASEDGYLLIDTGWNSDESFKAFESEMTDAGVDFKDIKQILLTHAHIDHYGLVSRIYQLSKAVIYMHHMDEEIFRTRYNASEEYLRQSEEWFYSNGVPPSTMPMGRMSSSGARTLSWLQQPDVLLNGTETISFSKFNLRVIWTPGHSPGHICLYEPTSKLLFSGDHVLPAAIPNISLLPGSKSDPLADFLESLERVRELDTEIILPAHGNIFHELKQRIDKIIEYRTLRNKEIMEALDTGMKTAFEICGFITWKLELGGVKFKDLMPGDQRAAVSETLAHLRALTNQCKVKVTNRENIWYYERAGT